MNTDVQERVAEQQEAIKEYQRQAELRRALDVAEKYKALQVTGCDIEFLRTMGIRWEW